MYLNDDDGDVTLVIEDPSNPLPCGQVWVFQILRLKASW